MQLLDLLESFEPSFASDPRDVGQNKLLQLLAFAQFFPRFLNPLTISPLSAHDLIWYKDPNDIALDAVSMYKGKGDILTLYVDILNLLRCDILSLR